MWPTYPRMAMPKVWRRRGRIARSTGQLAENRHPPNRGAIAFYEKVLFEPWVKRRSLPGWWPPLVATLLKDYQGFL